MTHSYAERAQNTLYSEFLVSVEITDERGKTYLGRHALTLLNSAFETFAKKRIVAISAQLEPRFPVLGSDGLVRQSVRLHHHHHQPVRLEKLLVIRQYAPDTRSGRADVSETTPAMVLGPQAQVIPPGTGLERMLTLDTRAEPDLLALTFRIEGVSADGHHVQGMVSIMRPPPQPTRDNSEPITDRGLERRIKRALALLGTPTVTDEDLWRLEREGKLSTLDPAEGTSGALVHPRGAPASPAGSAAAPVRRARPEGRPPVRM